jgi:catechol 2,3-dioxygenase-like lactoylglutathione lyase family enzyme
VTSSESATHRAASAVAVAHVGLTVSDLDKAVSWYENVLGLRRLLGPVEIEVDENHLGRQVLDIFRTRLPQVSSGSLAGRQRCCLGAIRARRASRRAARRVHLLERVGIFHLCLLASDIEALAAVISGSGGRVRTSTIWQIFEGEPYRTRYCEDRSGNIIELYMHPHAEAFGQRASY